MGTWSVEKRSLVHSHFSNNSLLAFVSIKIDKGKKSFRTPSIDKSRLHIRSIHSCCIHRLEAALALGEGPVGPHTQREGAL